MALRLDASSEAARDLAKRCVPEGGVMGMGVLLQALFHGSTLKDHFPQFAEFLPTPEEHRTETPDSVPLAAGLKPVLTELAEKGGEALTPSAWFGALLESQSGRDYAITAGFSSEDLDAAVQAIRSDGGSPGPAPTNGSGGWRESKEREQVVDALSTFGRMLTDGDPPQEGIVEMEKSVQSLVHALVQRKQHSALVIGLPGTGKSALVYELTRRLMTGHSSVPERLRDHDVFELSPIFLRSGASYVGQYEERVSSLLRVLTAHPKVILFVDEAHSMFQSGMDHRGPFTDANEAFKQSIMSGEITVIGCTTTDEYRHYIKPSVALDERFTKVKIEEPSPEETREIMQGRRSRMEDFYGVEISPELIDRTVQLADQYLLGRAQPRKSIQLLDGACAYCLIEDPPWERLTEDALWKSLEDTIGHSVVRERKFVAEDLLKELKSKIVGQDEALAGISTAFVTGIKGWTQAAEQPRGVFLFSGPTGVGKTETAVLLSRILGGGKEAMLRVDCNTLKGSGHDGGPAQNVLFGPPPGYIGFVRGKGGVLSPIRDNPECIVLFDEIEKADPNVGELLFRIIDDGQCEDKEGNPLDFRRSFIVFTTNAGAVYQEEKSIGFGPEGSSSSGGPRTDHSAMRAHFARMGLGEAFLGRMTHFFDFNGLDRRAARGILEAMMGGFAETCETKGFSLEWDQEVLDHLTLDWEPGLGARGMAGVLRNRVMSQVILTDTRDELEGVKTIRLEMLDGKAAEEARKLEGLATRTRYDDTMVISLA